MQSIEMQILKANIKAKLLEVMTETCKDREDENINIGKSLAYEDVLHKIQELEENIII